MLSTVCSCNKSRVERNYLEGLKTNTRKITSSPQALTFSPNPQQKEYHRLGSFNNFPGSSAGKESTCNTGRPQFDFWVWKIPWRWEWLATQVFRPGEFHGLYSPWCHKQSNMIEQLSLSLSTNAVTLCSQSFNLEFGGNTGHNGDMKGLTWVSHPGNAPAKFGTQAA